MLFNVQCWWRPLEALSCSDLFIIWKFPLLSPSLPPPCYSIIPASAELKRLIMRVVVWWCLGGGWRRPLLCCARAGWLAGWVVGTDTTAAGFPDTCFIPDLWLTLTQKRKWRSICRIGVRAHCENILFYKLTNILKFRKLGKLFVNFLCEQFSVF